jgi:multiple sugar transport system ATP-binding protein
MNVLPGEVRAGDGALHLRGREFDVRLTGRQVESLRRCAFPASARVLVGIRPEHLKIRRAWEPSERDLVIQGSVEIVQTLGSETLVRLTCADGHLTIRVDPDIGAAEGERLQVAVSPDRIRLFHPDTGERVA